MRAESVDMVPLDFLGMSDRPEVKNIARETLDRLGCGSCGPRGFYGTIAEHAKVEKDIAQFLGSEDAILYSDASSAISSSISAFSKKGDLLLADEHSNESIRTGLNLSRSTVLLFKHNDMTDLENILEGISSEDQRSGRNPTSQRRFIVVEAIYQETGQISPLREVHLCPIAPHERTTLVSLRSFVGCCCCGYISLFFRLSRLSSLTSPSSLTSSSSFVSLLPFLLLVRTRTDCGLGSTLLLPHHPR
jgi:hypothetical protein